MSKKNKWALPIALAALALLSILIFYVPVRQPAFLDGARRVHLSVSEMFVTGDKPDSSRISAELEAGDPALEELAAIFDSCRYYRTLKFFDTLDGAATYSGEDARSTFLLGVLTQDEVYHSMSIHGKYLHYAGQLWRLRGDDVEALRQRLKDFILEHSED